ncbi:MAG: histidine phosphatase family protein [Oscillospiraceae bacterium]|nr:histidine phosphatase family protein [Oscillospiraceae bacterium]
MKNIITIQHTQSVHHTNGMVGSWTDWELTELGVNQAKRIGERLKAELEGREFVIYSSDLLRAKQTAEIVGDFPGSSPILRTELRERNLGKCCGKSVQWLRENAEQQEKSIDDRFFYDAESRRDEWSRLILDDEAAPVLVYHGLNGVYIKECKKWIRLDARGNKEGVNAQFSLDNEQLAFSIRPEKGEEDRFIVYPCPDKKVLEKLRKNKTRTELFDDLPTELGYNA